MEEISKTKESLMNALAYLGHASESALAIGEVLLAQENKHNFETTDIKVKTHIFALALAVSTVLSACHKSLIEKDEMWELYDLFEGLTLASLQEFFKIELRDKHETNNH